MVLRHAAHVLCYGVYVLRYGTDFVIQVFLFFVQDVKFVVEPPF